MSVAYQRRSQIVESLVAEAKAASARGEVSKAWALLANAHVISQPVAWPHTVVHWKMLSLAVRTHNLKEILGQLFRLFAAAPGSVLKKYPKGNPGTSDVSTFQAMPVSMEVQSIIDRIDEPDFKL